MKKAVLFLFLFYAAVGIQAQTDRDACWLNAATGAWEWGFFKDFAVHDGNGNMPPSRKAERKPPSPYEAAKKPCNWKSATETTPFAPSPSTTERHRPTGCGTARKASFPTCQLTTRRRNHAVTGKTASHCAVICPVWSMPLLPVPCPNSPNIPNSRHKPTHSDVSGCAFQPLDRHKPFAASRGTRSRYCSIRNKTITCTWTAVPLY